MTYTVLYDPIWFYDPGNYPKISLALVDSVLFLSDETERKSYVYLPFVHLIQTVPAYFWLLGHLNLNSYCKNSFVMLVIVQCYTIIHQINCFVILIEQYQPNTWGEWFT